MICEICGTEGRMLKAIVEDAELNVCEKCSKFGKVTGIVKNIEQKPQKAAVESEKISLLSDNYAEMIKKKREMLNLTQEEFAKKISQKESLVHKIESGSLEPSQQLAKKIEKFLGIKITEEYEEKHEKHKNRNIGGFTLGDFIKAKRK